MYVAVVPFCFGYMAYKTDVSGPSAHHERLNLTSFSGQVRVQRKAERGHDCGVLAFGMYGAAHEDPPTRLHLYILLTAAVDSEQSETGSPLQIQVSEEASRP
jgi:hypothetical protein